MPIESLMALSPLDGRYQASLATLRSIFSEYGLIRFRVQVEIEWLKFLTGSYLPDLKSLTPEAKDFLDSILKDFTEQDALSIKALETQINHDVKAVEYFIKDRLKNHAQLNKMREFVHFGCTSEDINNLAYSLMLKTAVKKCLEPALSHLLGLLKKFALTHAGLSMLSHTHGQPATPTTVGKEIANVYVRLKRQMDYLHDFTFLGKFNGASGNYNALVIAYPKANWPALCQAFVEKLGLTFNAYTTQIEPHDSASEFFAILERINVILIDFNRDVWAYIAINYFQQKPQDNEVGSSTMPHKVNPIDFENAEGNLGIANALLAHMIAKLPISRWQRDLSDSTVMRNVGVALGHSLLAYKSTCKGIEKLAPNKSTIQADLDQHFEVLAEAIQTVMRCHGLKEPYEQLKAFTRGKEIDKLTLQNFIETLDLPMDVKQRLLALTPKRYTGNAEDLTRAI